MAWSDRPLRFQGETNDTAALGVYLYDAFGNLTLLYRDPAMGSQYPLPVRPRPRPPIVGSQARDRSSPEGRMLLVNVYQGSAACPPGTIKRLRIVGMPVKTHPTMDSPSIGVTTHDTGRFVLGTVPVEADGSAWFRVPAGVTFFMQALDEDGMAVQTMRSGATCSRARRRPASAATSADHGPANAMLRWPLAASRRSSRPDRKAPGRWTMRRSSSRCSTGSAWHATSRAPKEQKFDLTAAHSYDAMVGYGSPSLKDLVIQRYREQRSVAGQCEARMNPVLKLLKQGHYDVKLQSDDWSRLITWMDTLGQRSGSFSPEQEAQLRKLRQDMAGILEPYPSGPHPSADKADHGGGRFQAASDALEKTSY